MEVFIERVTGGFIQACDNENMQGGIRTMVPAAMDTSYSHCLETVSGIFKVELKNCVDLMNILKKS